MYKKSLILLLISLFSLQTTQPVTQQQLLSGLKTISLSLATLIPLSLCETLIHEMGHSLAGKVLHNDAGTLTINWKNQIISMFSLTPNGVGGSVQFSNLPEGLKTAGVFVAGPLAGISFCLGLIFLANKIAKHHNIAPEDRFKINLDDTPLIQITKTMAIFGIMQIVQELLLNIIPHKIPGTYIDNDGAQIIHNVKAYF